MPSRPVGAVLRKAIRVSGAHREFLSRCLSSIRFLQIADTVLHVDALLFCVYLSWRLIKVFASLPVRGHLFAHLR